MSFWVYILASKPFGTLYVGVTNDVVRRAYEHREGLFAGYEEHESAPEAIQRENIKHWPRAWKIELVRKMNPEWRDLFDEIAQR